MSIIIQSENGLVEVSDDVLAVIAGVAATECYGVVGMANAKLKDGFVELLSKKENFSKGINVKTTETNFEVNLYVILAFGTKISEVCYSIQDKVKFSLEQALNIKVDTVNVFVQSVKVIEEKK